MEKTPNFEDNIDFWAQFWPTIKMDKTEKNKHSPDFNLAKLNPEVFSVLIKVMEMGYSVCFL